MELNSGPVNCLLCLKSLQTHKPLKWQDEEFVEGIENECTTKVNDQLRVIFLLRKLLDVPVDVCGEILQSYGDPYYWISCCDSCSVLVEKGIQIFNQILFLQRKLDKVQDNLKSSIFNSGKLFSNENSSKGATWILRSYVTNEVKRASATLEVDHFQLRYSPLDPFSSQSGNHLDCTSDDNILNVKSESEILTKIENDSENIVSNCNNGKEAHAKLITGDLDFQSGTNCEPNSSTAVNSIPKNESSKKKRVGRKRQRIQRNHTGDKCFSCDICGKEFLRPGILQKHLRTHTGEMAYKCDICGKGHSRSDDLEHHLRTHTGKRPYECDICKKGFTNLTSLKSHLILHTKKPFKCNICGKCFSESSTLKQHAHKHTGERRFKCDICGKGFFYSCYLKQHAATHTGERPFTCDICGKEFGLSGNLKIHILTHTGERPYKCDICGMAFSTANTLKKHVYSHSRDKPYKCDICGKEYSRPDILKKHLRTHTIEKPYECDICRRRFTRAVFLKTHLILHKMPFKCDICEKCFPDTSSLKSHIEKAHAPTGERPHDCDICANGLLFGRNLRDHIRTHTEEKLFECNICGKRFKSTQSVNKHKKWHAEIPQLPNWKGSSEKTAGGSPREEYILP